MVPTHQTPRSYCVNAEISVQRIYGGTQAAPWLITMPSMKMLSRGAVMLNSLQSRAVVDDFGDLVAVREWL